MTKYSELYAGLKPYIVELIRSTSLVAGAGTGTSGTGMQVHALDSSWHTGTLDPSQAPWALSSYRTVAAGAGLTGGGNLTSDISLDVAAGDGIEVAGDAVAVKLKTTSGLELDATGLSSVTPATLTVATTNSLANHTHAITSSSNPGAAASILATNSSGVLQLATLKVGAAATYNSNNDVAAAPDVQFATSGLVAAETSLYWQIDSNDDSTSAIYAWRMNGATSNAGSELMRLTESGRLGIGDSTPSYELDVAGTGQLQTSLITPTVYAPTLTTSSGGMTISPVGDLTLYPGGGDVLPGSSALIDLGHYNRKYRTLYAQELYVETLVAQDVISTIGGRIEVTPTTTLIADLASAATTMDVKHNNLRNGEFAYLMAAPGGVAQYEVIKVDSAASSITGGYRYTILRNRDGTGANDWVIGDAVASMGLNNGDGFISLTATSTLLSHLGPTMTVYSRTGSSWNSLKATTATGNLESFVDYSAPEFGFAVGNDLTLDATTGFKGLTADRTNGVRLFSTDLSFYSGATQTGSITSTGTLWFGTSSAAKKLSWDGAALTIDGSGTFSGSITATSGAIAGWTIDTSEIKNSTGYIHLVSGAAGTARIEVGDQTTAGRGGGICSRSTAAGIVFWAGEPYDSDLTTAPFTVTSAGALKATSATLTGSFTAGNVNITSSTAMTIAVSAAINANAAINITYNGDTIGTIGGYGTGAGVGILWLASAGGIYLNGPVTLYSGSTLETTGNITGGKFVASGTTGYLRASTTDILSWTSSGVTTTASLTAPSVRAASGTWYAGVGSTNYFSVSSTRIATTATYAGDDWVAVDIYTDNVPGDWVSGYEGYSKKFGDLIWMRGRLDPANSVSTNVTKQVLTITSTHRPNREIAKYIVAHKAAGGYEVVTAVIGTNGSVTIGLTNAWNSYDWVDFNMEWSTQ